MMATRDIVVAGASAGGIEPLQHLVACLDPGLPASVFVVLHLAADQPSALAEVLGRAGPLPAIVPRDGEPIRPGRIYVGPPDLHLMVEPGIVRVLMGPRENRHRPSVDVLFRSAARAYGPRVVGIVLSGSLDDGTAGLIAVKVRGGVAVVQDPAEAFSADMPRNAMRYLEVDHVVPSRELGRLVTQLSRESVEVSMAPPPTSEMMQETRIAKLDREALGNDDKPGVQSVVACPDCRGVLWEIQEGNLIRFRCRTGHAYSPETLLDEENNGVETALWEALRAIEERASLRRRLVKQAKERRLETLGQHFETQAEEGEAAVRALRQLLMGRTKD